MELYRQKQTKTSCWSVQVLLRARHLEQGGRPAASLPVRRGAQEHRGDRLQWLLDTPQHPPTPPSTPLRPLLEAWRLLQGPEDVPPITLSLFQVLPEFSARIFTSAVTHGRLRGPSDDGLRSESSRLGGTDAFKACSTRNGSDHAAAVADGEASSAWDQALKNVVAGTGRGGKRTIPDGAAPPRSDGG